MASSDVELEEQLLEAGNKLEDPPSSVEELLSLLNQVEGFLTRVEQSPTNSMQNALSPSMQALVADKLLRHSDVDVKVAIASCISEITRISAPDAPYDDDQMKEVFQLIVSSFENLSDKSSRSYAKRTSILETVAKVRSCVVMLDLECDSLILEMFQHFFKEIREHHPENIFSAMETVMTLVLEESEDIPLSLLSPLLSSIKKDNEEVLPIAQQLGERVLECCATRLKPYIVQAVKTLGVSVEDYSSVLASICQDSSSEQNDVCATREHVELENKPVEQSLEEPKQVIKEDAQDTAPSQQDNPVGDGSTKPSMSNGTAQVGEDDTSADPQSPKKQEVADCSDQLKGMNTEQGDNSEPKQKQTSEKQARKSGSSVKSAEPSVGQTVANEQEGDKKLGSDQSKDISGHEVPNNLDTETVENREQKEEQATKRDGRKSSTSAKSTDPTMDKAVDNEKETENKLSSGSHSKEVQSSLHENHYVEAAGPPENEKEIKPKISSPETGALDSKTVEGSEQKPVQANKRGGRKSSSSVKSTEPSVDQAVNNKKEAKVKLDSESQGKEVPNSPQENHSVEAAGTSENNDNEIKPKISSPEAGNNESEAVASPSPHESLHDENRSKKNSQAKSKGGSEKKVVVEDASKKVFDDSESKPAKRTGKKALGRNNDVKKTPLLDSVRKGSKDTSDLDATKKSAKIVDQSKKAGDGSSSKQFGDKKKLGRGKADSEAGVAKDVDKENVSSPRSGAKGIKDEETPKISMKRKLTSGKENSNTTEYGENLVGLQVEVWWPADREFYKGVIGSFDSAVKKHKVMYDDGDIEVLNLRKEKWKIIKAESDSDQEEGSDDANLDTSADMPSKKKGKTSPGESIKQRKMDASSKSGGAASSSRSKGASTKSISKSKDGSKSKDSKTIGKSEDESGEKSNTPKSGSNKSATAATQKLTGKSKDNNSSKPSKSKDDERRDTPKMGKSKQETLKTVSKVKSPKSGGKVKSGLLKRKFLENEDSDSVASAKETEDAKGKTSSSSKAHGSLSKSGTKQRKG